MKTVARFASRRRQARNDKVMSAEPKCTVCENIKKINNMKNKFKLFLIGLIIPCTTLAQGSVSGGASEGYETTSGGLSEFFSLERLFEYLGAFIVFIVSVFIAWILKTIVLQAIEKSRGEYTREATKILIGRVVFVTTITVGATISLQLIGLDIWTVMAALGFGIGFALKDIISSFVAGVTILVQEKINIGDLILIGKKEENIFGTVVDITSRATHMQKFDGTEIIVPNADLISKPVISYSVNPFRRIEVIVQIAFGSDINKARSVILNGIKDMEGIEPNPTPSVYATAFLDSAIEIRTRFWVQSRSGWFDTRSQVIERIQSELKAAGITIPFPVRTLNIDKLDENDRKEIHELNRQVANQTTPEQA